MTQDSSPICSATRSATECELKFSLSDDTARALCDYLDAHTTSLSTLQLGNEYFDTPDGDLNQQRIGCRIRRWTDNGREHAEQTIKLAGQIKDGLHQRPEYNLPQGKQQTPDLTSFAPQIWPVNMDMSAVNKALQCIFKVEFERRRWHANWPLSGGATSVEIVFDQGFIYAGAKQEAIFEIEIELLEGSVDDLLQLAKMLTSKFKLHEFNKSKAERGFALAAKISQQ
ncbi:MAG: CYTH domain-containing protein [Idiomarina sp.]|nr:CYTH domain-containing protein [Idiomarina sp.]